jgi:hypothetical protein
VVFVKNGAASQSCDLKSLNLKRRRNNVDLEQDSFNVISSVKYKRTAEAVDGDPKQDYTSLPPLFV